MTHPLTEHVIRFPELPAGHERPGLVFAPSRKAVRTPMAALRAFSELQLRTDDEPTLDGAARHSLHAARAANLLRGNRLLWSISIFLVALLCLAGEAAMVGIDRIA